MTTHEDRAGLKVAGELVAVVEQDVLPGLGLDEAAFWSGAAAIFERFAPENRSLLARRDALQAQIDDWHRARRGQPHDAAAYRAFVQDPEFLAFFERVTPIHEISRLNIASRPVRRPGAPTLQNLRAIPWVMSWTQDRLNLPGWYGLAEGLETIGLDTARDMYAQWPFFRSMLDNAQMSLAKSDLLIFAEYLSLVDDSAGNQRLTQHLKDKFAQTVQAVQEVVGAELMANEPRLRESIALRNPYIDPIHRIQAELLRRSRAQEGGLDEFEVPLLLSLQGVAAGVRNTG